MRLPPIAQEPFLNAEPNKRRLVEEERVLRAKRIRLSEAPNYTGNGESERGLVQAFNKWVSCLPPEQPLNNKTAWALWPLVRSQNEKTRHLVCKVLHQHHHDLKVRLAGGEERFMSSVLLGVKHPVYFPHALKAVRKAKESVDLTRITAEALEALQKAWEGVPLTKLIANDPQGKLVSEFIQAADFFGCEELLDPPYLVEAIREAYASNAKLTIDDQEQIVLESRLSSDAEVEEVRHLNQMFAVAGVGPRNTFFADSLAFYAYLFCLLYEDGLITRLKIEGTSGDAGATLLASILTVKDTLEQLDLNSTSIGDQGARRIGAALKTNSTLQRLVLCDNSIADEGAKAIGAALEKNSALQQLGLNRGNICDEGAKAMAAALANNSTLRRLDLRYNIIGNEGAKALAAGLANNNTLQRLDLRYNIINPEGATALAAALEKNSTLKQLDLEGNPIGDECKAFLSGIGNAGKVKLGV